MYQDDLITIAPAPAARSESGHSHSPNGTHNTTPSSSRKPSWSRKLHHPYSGGTPAYTATDDALVWPPSSIQGSPNGPARHKWQSSQASGLSYPPPYSRTSDDSDTKGPCSPTSDSSKPQIEVEPELSFGSLPVGLGSHGHEHRPITPARRWGMGRGLRVCCFIFCFILGACASLATTVLYLFDEAHEALFDVFYPLGGVCCFLGLGFLMSYMDQLRMILTPASIVPSTIMIGSFIMIGVSAYRLSVLFAVIFNGVMDISYILYAISIAPSVQRFFRAPACLRRK